MEDSTATELEVEACIGFEPDSPAVHHWPRGSSSSFLTRGREDACLSAPSDTSGASAAPDRETYTVVAQETTPLLRKHEPMSAQLSSPIEIAGIEGADGAGRPWLRALPAKKIPWWETPSVSSSIVLCGIETYVYFFVVGFLALAPLPTLLSGNGRRLCPKIKRDT